MKTKKWWRCVVLTAGVAACAPFISSQASDAQWVEYRENYFGYGGDYTEVVKTQFDTQTLIDTQAAMGFAELDANAYFPIAVPKSYVLRGGAGTLTVSSRDNVRGQLAYNIKTPNNVFELHLYAIADAVLGANAVIGATTNVPMALNDPNIKKFANHLFMQAQSFLLCASGTYSSPSKFASLAQNVDLVPGEFWTEVAIFYCPEGGFPFAQEAQFWHGVM